MALDPNMPTVGQIWKTHRAGDRWRVERLDPYGDPGTALMRAVDGRHAGHTDVLFKGEVRSCAALEPSSANDASEANRAD